MSYFSRFLASGFLGISLVLLVNSAQAFSPREPLVDTTRYAELLETYVMPDGVAYEQWFNHAEDLQALDLVLERWAQIPVDDLSPTEQKAFYINLYNAGMLQAVFQNYPLKSVKNIGFLPFSIFKKDFIQLGDEMLSLDDIEKGILLKTFPDPRIHFAVNCASESCPPLRAEPFRSAVLEAQLDEQTRLFAESDRAARIIQKKRYAYSELFNWYDSDFAGEHPAEYLNRYRSESLPTTGKFDWIPYDWSLNAVK